MRAVDVVLSVPPMILVLGLSGLVAVLAGLGRHPWVVAWTLIVAIALTALSPGQRAAAGAAWETGSPGDASRCMAASLARADVWLGDAEPSDLASCRADTAAS